MAPGPHRAVAVVNTCTIQQYKLKKDPSKQVTLKLPPYGVNRAPLLTLWHHDSYSLCNVLC